MKKLLALVIAAGLCAGLCGCASTMKIDADVHLIPSITDGSEPDAGLPGEIAAEKRSPHFDEIRQRERRI